MIQIKITGLDNLKKAINKVTDKSLLDYAKSVYSKLSDERKNVEKYLKGFLSAKAPAKEPYPNTISGNLLRNLIHIRMNKQKNNLKVRYEGNKRVVSFKIIQELDGGDGDPTVLTKDGRNEPYARYLNYYKRFRTQGFFEKLNNQFKRKYEATIKQI